jgi:carbon monoxide dehydrogenase subunit G
VNILEEFSVARPIGEVWSLFLDIPDVARCLSGAEVTEDHGDGKYSGTVSVKLGPISSSFEGKATVTTDVAMHQMQIQGRGVDRTGGSQGRVKVLVSLVGTDDGHTDVSLDSDVTLAGPIAQFGRTGLVKEVSRRLIDEFADCLHAKLDAGSENEASEIEASDLKGLSLFFSSLWSWITSRIRRRPAGDE